jgi:hypothetical protein
VITVQLSYSANLVVFHDYFLKFGVSGRKWRVSFLCIIFIHHLFLNWERENTQQNLSHVLNTILCIDSHHS